MKEIIDKFTQLNKEEKKLFHIFIIENNIILARGIHNIENKKSDSFDKLLLLNEFQHQIMNALQDRIYSLTGYSNEDFFNLITKYSKDLNIKINFEKIFEKIEYLKK